MVGWLVGRFVGRSVCRSVGWSVVWLFGWSVGPVKGVENKKLAPKVRTPMRASANGAKQKVDTTKCPAEDSKHITPNQSFIEEIADLLDNLPLDVCVELTRRFLPALPNLSPGAARSRAVLKTVILFIAEYGRTAKRTNGGPLRLACWNADGVRGRRLEHFLGYHCVDICLLRETHLSPEQAFRFAYYVCNRTDRNAQGGGTAILVLRVIDHYALPVPGLRHLEATAIQTTLANRPVKILAVYPSPSRPLIKRDLSACLDGGLRVLMTGDLNAKHVDWNARVITTRGRLLRD